MADVSNIQGFIDTELLSQISALRTERDQFELLYDSAHAALNAALEEKIPEGSILLSPDERKILNGLLDGYTVGPEARKVLDKLKAGL